MDLTAIGWLHTLACCYALASGALVLTRVKGGAAHRASGKHYLAAMTLANLTALGVYRLGGFTVFHIMALATLASLALAFASARWRSPRRHWLRLHLTAIIFSYYMLVGGLINELFVRLPALHGERTLAAIIQSTAMVAFLMLLAYFWGRTARSSTGTGTSAAHLSTIEQES